ncbi:hypothetical protein BJ322DRAFT_61837 [Thelephora terrestris]|uniref:Uncharacterized protein n=1 Tax=Thelephora terrestris TaxID=56493 RepID=A0A9P6HQ73_9AGAM|nr:hypothetical protein BJ322DRAFT_61837 [Thelephora terrestris]
MPTKKSRRHTTKPGDVPKQSPADSHPNLRPIIQENLTKFMGRRFPEFCTMRAICLVSAKASSTATGDARVASYQAAIDSVAKRYYADLPFMVEVLNKWLEMNQDFVRDPIGYTASHSSPTPPSTTTEDHTIIPAIQETPYQALALTHDGALIQLPPAAVDTVSSPLPSGDEHTVDPSPPPTTSVIGPNDSHLPSNNRLDLHFPFFWTGTIPFFSSLWNLGVGTLSFVGPTRNWFVTPKSATQRTSSPSDARWPSLNFLAGSYKEWWDTLKGPFALRSGRYPKFK